MPDDPLAFLADHPEVRAVETVRLARVDDRACFGVIVRLERTEASKAAEVGVRTWRWAAEVAFKLAKFRETEEGRR